MQFGVQHGSRNLTAMNYNVTPLPRNPPAPQTADGSICCINIVPRVHVAQK